ncbi:MAG: hypothetical protein H7Y02_06000, partial [Candidatus Obscuribacterales bacterium]|nr:hypothetical protein [Steroidobacteraceae bacterium]
MLITFPLFVIGFVALLYIGACAFLYAVQDSFIFYPVKNDERLLNEWSQRRVEISGPEGIIEGWWAENPSSRTAAVVLYFGGNAEDVLYSASAAEKFAARRFLVTNYRGYGAIAGKPSERALFADALAVYDYAVKQPNVSASNIVVMGRSLGSGVATYIA